MSSAPPRRPVGAAALVLLLAVVAGWAVAGRRDSAADSHRDRVVKAGQSLVAAAGRDLQATTDDVSAQLAAGRPVAADPALQARVVVDPGFHVLTGNALADGTFPLPSLGDSALRTAGQLAVDRGDAIGATVGRGSSAVTLVLWPMFRPGPVQTTEQRRDAVEGFLVAVLAPASVVDAVTQPLSALDPGIAVRGPVAAAPGAVSDVVRASYVVLPSPAPSHLSLAAGIALLVALVGLAGVVGARRLQGRAAEQVRRVQQLEQQLALLADLGASAQSGLDVSLTLPAVLAQLQTGLDLDHLVVRSGSGSGSEVLAMGVQPVGGTTLTFPLHRALRTIGVLEVTSRSEVPAEGQQTLQAAADIIAGFLHNSDLFEREQLAVARLQSLDRLKDDFLGTVSHELRTPLAIIVGFLSMLRSRYRKMTDEERSAAFATISNHATALTALVNDLLDFVTDRRGSHQLQLVPGPLAEPVAEIVERFRPLFADHALTVALDDSTQVTTDKRAIERILTNLLSNASKYSPAGTVIEVSVGTVAEGGAMTVRDHGPGIADEDRELVFERFYRGSTDAARGTRGTGIGLTIVKTWLELVGARLEVRSEPGNGTQMTVVFPADADTALDQAGQIVWREFVPTLSEGVPS